MNVTEDEVDFYLTSEGEEILFETLEIYHPHFKQRHLVCRNADVDGLVANLETGESVLFVYYPLEISGGAEENNLDFSLTINLGDLGSLFETESENLDAVPGAWDIYPTVIYRSYRSNNLNRPLTGPIRLEMEGYAYDDDGSSTLVASAKRLNVTGTGERWDFEKCKPLRGFLK